jgi:hypothetical protein
MLYALCSMLYALCSMLYALCSMLYALCSMLYAHTRPHTPTHAHTCPSPLQKKFLRLYVALLTIFYGFLDDFLQLYLFCFICSTKFIHAVQKSVAHFEGGVYETGGRCVCVKAILWTACCCQKVWKSMDKKKKIGQTLQMTSANIRMTSTRKCANSHVSWQMHM